MVLGLYEMECRQHGPCSMCTVPGSLQKLFFCLHDMEDECIEVTARPGFPEEQVLGAGQVDSLLQFHRTNALAQARLGGSFWSVLV